LSPFAGTGYRHLSPRYDPLNGEGARLNGGRFNPPGSFPVLYICGTRDCAAAELRRVGQRQAVGVEGLLPRHLYVYQIMLDRVLNLTDLATRVAAGVSTEVLTGPDWTACQEVGMAAHALGAQAVISPSATGTDYVVAVFMQNLGMGSLEPRFEEEWAVLDDLGGGPAR
jgi:RES domain-containing protein